MRRDVSKAHFGVQYEQADGQGVVRRPDPDVALRYLVTAWAGEPRDEHQLLGSVLRALIAHGPIPAEHVAADLDVVGGVAIEVAAGEGRPSDFWSSLDGQLKPGFLVIAQNAEGLLSDRAYRSVIDGLGKEDLLYGGRASSQRSTRTSGPPGCNVGARAAGSERMSAMSQAWRTSNIEGRTSNVEGRKFWRRSVF